MGPGQGGLPCGIWDTDSLVDPCGYSENFKGRVLEEGVGAYQILDGEEGLKLLTPFPR